MRDILLPWLGLLFPGQLTGYGSHVNSYFMNRIWTETKILIFADCNLCTVARRVLGQEVGN